MYEQYLSLAKEYLKSSIESRTDNTLKYIQKETTWGDVITDKIIGLDKGLLGRASVWTSALWARFQVWVDKLD